MSNNPTKEIRLHEGELNVMELLWSNKVLAAKDISKIIKEYIGWEKNTTYTVIKRLIDKGAVQREDPGFLCSAKVTKREIQNIETKALLKKMFNGSLSTFITDYLDYQTLTTSQIIELQRIINNRNIAFVFILFTLDKGGILLNWKTITNELHKRWVFITSDTKQTIMAIIELLLVIGVIIMLRHMHIRNQYSDEA